MTSPPLPPLPEEEDPVATPRRVGAVVVAVLLFAVDQLSKLFVLHRLDLADGPVRVLPFMDLTLVWNRGISYGLFQQSGLGRWILVALTLAAVVVLSLWLRRTQKSVVAYAIEVILGGAVGNLVDRVVYGAVVDFVHLFYAGYSWYVFNIADAAIVVGVIVLLGEGLFSRRTDG